MISYEFICFFYASSESYAITLITCHAMANGWWISISKEHGLNNTEVFAGDPREMSLGIAKRSHGFPRRCAAEVWCPVAGRQACEHCGGGSSRLTWFGTVFLTFSVSGTSWKWKSFGVPPSSVVFLVPGTPMHGMSPFAILPAIRKELLREDGIVVPSLACLEVALVESLGRPTNWADSWAPLAWDWAEVKSCPTCFWSPMAAGTGWTWGNGIGRRGLLVSRLFLWTVEAWFSIEFGY